MRNDKKIIKKYIMTAVAIAVLIIGVVLSVKIGARSIEKAYDKAYENASGQTKEKWFEWAFQKAEKKYHVSNEVNISIEDIATQSNLEVLAVSDTELINKNNTEFWLAIPGNGIFTVNMMRSEFLIDNERHSVIARLPEPALTEAKIDSKNIQTYDFKTGEVFNGDYSEGVSYAEDCYKEAQDKIETEFNSNQQYLVMAEQSAEKLITNLIMNLNPDVNDLKVSIEFID